MLKLARMLFSLAVTLTLFAVLSSTTYFWSGNGLLLLDSGKYLSIPIVLCLLISLILVQGKISQLTFETSAFACGLLLVFFSNWLCRGYSLLQGPAIRGEIILGFILSLALFRKHLLKALSLFTPAAIIILIIAFFQTCQGRLIFGDDHSSFYYRLMLLKENFPLIPFFNPLWNAGVESREFFPSGILNIFFLTSPLIYAFEVEKIYNIIIAFILFILTPSATYLACRLEKLNKPIPAIAALLAICNSQIWYEWALSFGTIGFITSVALIPVIISLSAKMLAKDEHLSLSETILLAISSTLMLFWSLSGVVFVPIILTSLFFIPRILKKRFMLSMFIMLFLINIPWITIFIQASHVFNFMNSEKDDQKSTTTISAPLNQDSQTVTSENSNTQTTPTINKRKYKHRAGSLSISKAKEQIRQKASSSNPLLVFLAIPGIFLLKRRTKIPYLLVSLWLLFLGSVAVPLKPQLELDRMLIVLVFLFSMPAAIALYELIKRAYEINSFRHLLLATFSCGFLFASPFSVASILHNRTLTQIYFKSDTYQGLSTAIKEKAPSDGRTLFAGFILHQLSNGHIAPLVMELQHPIVASSYQHDKWWYTDIVPVEYLKEGSKGIIKYLDLYNITSIVAHEEKHKELLLKQPQKYELIWQSNNNRFMLFKRKNYQSNYFVSGQGKILQQTTNKITLKLKDPAAVIKFTYFPFLQATACKLSEENISEHVKFIKLTECPINQEITISAKNAIQRFF